MPWLSLQTTQPGQTTARVFVEDFVSSMPALRDDEDDIAKVFSGYPMAPTFDRRAPTDETGENVARAFSSYTLDTPGHRASSAQDKNPYVAKAIVARGQNGGDKSGSHHAKRLDPVPN